MSKHWKSIVAGGAGAIALAVVLGGAGRSLDERKPVSGDAVGRDTAISVPSHSGQQPSPRPVAASNEADPAKGETASSGVRRVDPTTVCMVNDRAMGKPQIPIEVDSKTYYGCCEMCKQRLAQDEAVRYAKDPVTGERVDKAKAVIAERPDGSVLYFASAETLARYGKPAGKQ